MNKKDNFFKKEVHLSDSSLFFPPGLEKFFLVIYIILVPYLIGLFFLYFIIANANLDMFLSLHTDYLYAITWIIGYEVLAVGVVSYFIFKTIGFLTKK